MAILRPDTSTTLNGVKINEYLLTKHNPNRIDMPSVSMEGKVIGVTVHNLKVKLYADMRDGVVSREEYIDMSRRFTEKAESIRKRIDDLIQIKQTALSENDSDVS